jgi:hypothetical protein
VGRRESGAPSCSELFICRWRFTRLPFLTRVWLGFLVSSSSLRFSLDHGRVCNRLGLSRLVVLFFREQRI